WKCDETSGTTLADSSGGGRTATLTGSYAVNTAGISAGNSGKSVDLTGGHAEIPNDAILKGIASEWTVAGWINYDSAGENACLFTSEFGSS
ncbi:hypothetical protein, partial [Streptococcus pneumoniae]|uniref:hypothetical protein n=1 Tax=Streptococcus pneumoniae TaxID=1313 RepID=UPI001E4884AF